MPHAASTTPATAEHARPRVRAAKVPAIRAPLSLDEADTSRYIGFSRSWLKQHRSRGEGPLFLRVGRTIRYRVADLDAWLDRHCVRHGSIV